MQKFIKHQGVAVPLMKPNIDTDQIIPKQFLKRVERTGYGDYLFFDWRLDGAGNPLPDFPLNQKNFSGASILISGGNFGCGSSREHAVWALNDFGFRAVIAPSFADIFQSNAAKNGLLTIALEDQMVERLAELANSSIGATFTIDLEAGTITNPNGRTVRFRIDEFRRRCFLEGLDDIGLTLQHEAEINAFEDRRSARL